MFDPGDVDNFGVRELAFDLGNATLAETLLLAGGVILGVFPQVAVFPGLRDGGGNRWADHGFQMLQFFPQLPFARNCHGHSAHE